MEGADGTGRTDAGSAATAIYKKCFAGDEVDGADATEDYTVSAIRTCATDDLKFLALALYMLYAIRRRSLEGVLP